MTARLLVDLGDPAPALPRPPSRAELRAQVLATQAMQAYRCAVCRKLFESLDVVERDGQLVGVCRADRVRGPRGPVKQRQREVIGTRRRRKIG